ncbi:MAG: ABC transporter substrate-binding protein [Candidatus Rokuibacteriota bacterium]|nr:MAG: ABC transporter substrate-binding protein [Candidatus Rokubacteria bacterium]
MVGWQVAVAALVALLSPLEAGAAPAGKVVIAQGVDPTTLDMANQSESPASNVGRHIFDTLYDRDTNLKIVPSLATEMPKFVPPSAWEVKLRKGVKFHNGEDFNADSAKFTFERLVQGQGKLRGATFFAPIERVEIVDSYTIRVHTKKPWPTFLPVMTFPQSGMLPPRESAGKETADLSRKPIGTGPYKFVRWSKDEEIVLEANAAYWRGAPQIKTVIFRPIPEDASRVAALQNGEIDLAVNIPPHLGAIIDRHPKLFLSTAPSIRTIQLMFYTHQMDAQHKPTGPYHGPTADKRVRQAIAYAIDADELIKTVLDGKGVRVATMLPSMHFGYDPTLQPLKADVGRARKLLAEAGFGGGVEITLHGPRGRYVRDAEVAEAVAGQLSKAGIKTTLRTYDFVTYLNSMVYVHKAGPTWLIGWGTGTMDAETVYGPLFKSPGIFVNWHNEDFNRMVDEAQAIMDDKKRLEQYHRINRLWLDEMPAVPLYQQVDLYGVSKRLNWKARSDEVLQAYTMSLKDGK